MTEIAVAALSVFLIDIRVPPSISEFVSLAYSLNASCVNIIFYARKF